MLERGNGKGPPLLALCVCTAKRPHDLQRLLQAIARAELAPLAPLRLRLLVVDNAPGGETERILSVAAPALPMPVTLEVEPVRGISHARNRAVDAALALGAELLAFVDDDDTPQPDWLVQLVAVWRRTGAAIVFGGSRHPPDAPIPRCLKGLAQFRPSQLDVIGADGLPRGIATCNVLLARPLLEHFRARGEVFSTAMNAGGDLEFFVRVRQAGFAMATAPASVVELGWQPERYSVRGVLYRRFDRSLARTQRALQHGMTRAALRRRAWGRLLRALRKLPTRLGDPTHGFMQVIRVLEHAGELAGTFGARSRYYR